MARRAGGSLDLGIWMFLAAGQLTLAGELTRKPNQKQTDYGRKSEAALDLG